MKKISKILAILVVLALAISVAACDPAITPVETPPPAPPANNDPAPADNNDEPPPPPPDEDIVISYIIDRDTEQSGFRAIMDAFTAQTGIRFEEELRPGGAEGETILKTRFATDDAPDMIWFNSGSLLATLNPAENLVDLTGQPFLNNLSDSFIQTVTFDNQIFGIPGTTAMAGGWLYNIAIYEELGLTVPTTWDELIANCEAIDAAGYTAVIASYADSWTSQLLVLADFHSVQSQVPNFAAEHDAGRAMFANTPAALRGFEKLADVHERGFLNRDFLAATYDQALEMLVNGDGVHYPMLTFALDNIYGTWGLETANNIGIFAQPADTAADTGMAIWMPSGWFACQGSNNLEYVMQFFEFYLSNEAQAIFNSVQRGVGPSVVVGVDVPPDAFTAVGQIMQYFANGKTAPALEFITQVKGPNLPQICVEVGSAISTPVQGAQDYDEDVRQTALQLGLPGDW